MKLTRDVIDRLLADGLITQEDVKQPTRPKYGNKWVELDGLRFQSAKEAHRYSELKLLQQAGEIRDLETQPPYEMHVNGLLVTTYIADFRYRDKGGGLVVEDAKSEATRRIRAYVIKKKLLKAIYGIEVKEV